MEVGGGGRTGWSLRARTVPGAAPVTGPVRGGGGAMSPPQPVLLCPGTERGITMG